MMPAMPPAIMPVAHTAIAADAITIAVAPLMPATACGIAMSNGNPGGYVGTCSPFALNVADLERDASREAS